MCEESEGIVNIADLVDEVIEKNLVLGCVSICGDARDKATLLFDICEYSLIKGVGAV